MALKCIEGFDIYSNAAQVLQRSGFLQWSRITDQTLQPGRFNYGQSLYISNNTNDPLRATLAANTQTGYIGMAAYLDANVLGTTSLSITVRETATNAEHFTIRLNGEDYSITHPFGRTVNNLYAGRTWLYVEVGFTISKNNGRIRVRINGTTVLDVTGNTAPNSVNEFMNSFDLVSGNNNSAYLDDLYFCDSTVGDGTYPNNFFLGDRRIYTLVPNAPGDLAQWAGSTSAANWTLAASADGDATYNASNTVGAEDLFGLVDLPSTVTQVLGVQVTGMYRKTDATSHTLTQRLKSGAVDAPGVNYLAPYSLSSSYVFYSDVFAVDPATAASWTVSAVNAVQIGYKLET